MLDQPPAQATRPVAAPGAKVEQLKGTRTCRWPADALAHTGRPNQELPALGQQRHQPHEEEERTQQAKQAHRRQRAHTPPEWAAALSGGTNPRDQERVNHLGHRPGVWVTNRIAGDNLAFNMDELPHIGVAQDRTIADCRLVVNHDIAAQHRPRAQLHLAPNPAIGADIDWCR